MKNKIVLAIVIFFLLLAAIISLIVYYNYKSKLPKELSEKSEKTAQDGWDYYENSRYQFSLVYPTGWKLEAAPTNNDGRGFTSPDGKVHCRAYGFSNALTNEKGEPQTLEEFLAWLTQQGLPMELIQEEDTEMASYPAKEIIFGQDGRVTRAVYILGYESGRALSCSYDNLKQEQLFRENFKVMKKSFKVDVTLE